MLTDELRSLEALLPGKEQPVAEPAAFRCNAVKEECERIKEAWNTAAFTDVADHSLERYFYFHLAGIGKVSDTLFEHSGNPDQDWCNTGLQKSLLALIDHLQAYFPRFFDGKANAPQAYYRRCLQRWRGAYTALSQSLSAAPIDQGLKECLRSYIKEMTDPERPFGFTFRALCYFEKWLEQLSVLNFYDKGTNEQLNKALIRLDFNYLEYLVYQQDRIRVALKEHPDQLEYLRQEQCTLPASPLPGGFTYDPLWPSLRGMLTEWLSGEIRAREKIAGTVAAGNSCFQPQKIPLDLSVAQLAFFIRLFYDGQFVATRNLTEIFKLVALHYRTKRQPMISPGSLSKEYYGTDQFTAAGVRGILQKMLHAINTQFFPVWLGVNVVIHFC
jgi:hypothetical protein